MTDETPTPPPLIERLAYIATQLRRDGDYRLATAVTEAIAALRSPAPGAAEMREALYCAFCGRETPHAPVPDQNPPTMTATTLPAREVPEAVREWCVEFDRNHAHARFWGYGLALRDWIRKEYGI